MAGIAAKGWLWVGMASLLAAAGCGQGLFNRSPAFDNIRFRTPVSTESRLNRADFTVSVRGADRSIEGARQAAAYAGTQHCITYFGSSEIVWATDPRDDSVDIPLSGDDLVVSGQCQDPR